MTRTFALLLALGTMLALALASSAGAASIVIYPLPKYEVSGSKYVNEDITNLVATPAGDIWWDAFAPGNLGEIEPANATPGTANGQRVIQVPGNTDGDYPEALALGPDGDLYFGLANPGGLWKIEPTAASPTPILVNNKTINNSNRPVEAAFSPKDGNLFFTSRANTVVEALDPGLESLTSTGEVSEPYPWGIAVDSAGNAWIGEDGRGGNANGEIGEIPYASGDHLLEYHTPDSPSEPQQLTVDHSGNVWFIDRVSNSIGELIPAATSPGTSDGITEYKIPVPAAGNAEEEPEDITTAANGSIWFTESYKSPFTATADNQIGEITQVSGQSTVVFSMQPTPDGAQPQAIVGDKAGNVWYSAGGGNSSDELGEVKEATTGGAEEEETKGGKEETKGNSTETTTTTTTNSSPITSTAPVETVTTSSGQSITLATAPGEAGYAELDKHLLGGLSGNDIAKLLANGGFSIQIPLTYPAYPGNYSANGTASPEGIPGYNGEGVEGGEFAGSGGDSLLASLARKKKVHHHHLAPVVLFHYQHDYTAAGTYTAKIHLTSAGLKLLRAAARAHRSLKVSVTLSLTAAGHTPINQKLSTTLKVGSKAGSKKKSGKR